MKEFEHYLLNKAGGRVKSAGLSAGFVFDQGKLFIDQPGPGSAAQITKTFNILRSNPPLPLRERFFPLRRDEVKAQTKNSPALFRPLLKTDQGPGKFLGFRIAESSERVLNFRVAYEQGYVIPEVYFMDQLQQKGFLRGVIQEMDSVRNNFKIGNLNETRLAYERLEQQSEQAGIIFRRRAKVGRDALFFIHPAQAVKPIILDHDLTRRIEKKVNETLPQLVETTETIKRKFARDNNLPFRSIEEISLPRYFQADLQLFPNGDFLIAEVQIPDVGLFLVDLPSDDYEVLQGIQQVVEPLKETVVDGLVLSIEDTYRRQGRIPIYLVTRSEVIENKEDVLEIKELDVVKKELRERGFETRIISVLQASGIDEDSLMFLFNLDPNSEEFTKLAKTYLSDSERKLIMTPDPFFRIAEKEFSGYNKVRINGRELANFLTLVGQTTQQQEGQYTLIMAIDNFFNKMGINEDVLHFCHPLVPAPIPVYRYDLRGLHIAGKEIRNIGLSEVTVRSIPISPERGILFGKDGGVLYATFRFMFTRR